MSDFIAEALEFCPPEDMKGEWRGAIRVSHLHLREDLLSRDKPPATYHCTRCGAQVIPAPTKETSDG